MEGGRKPLDAALSGRHLQITLSFLRWVPQTQVDGASPFELVAAVSREATKGLVAHLKFTTVKGRHRDGVWADFEQTHQDRVWPQRQGVGRGREEGLGRHVDPRLGALIRPHLPALESSSFNSRKFFNFT
jgi:hypothetical protein